jgi:hypothetical protein
MDIVHGNVISVYEKICLDITESNHNMLIPWYIMSAYAYYVEDDPIISDGMFDRICQRLLEDYVNVEHIHKKYIKKSTLESGTYLGEYPSRIEDVVRQLRRTYADQ